MADKCLIETSFLVKLLISPAVERINYVNLIKRYQTRLIPSYALKELKAGPIQYLRWLYEKLGETKSFAQTLEATTKIYRMRNRQATAQAALIEVQTYIESIGLKNILGSINEGESEAEIIAKFIQSEIKKKIMIAWRDRKIYGVPFKNLSCYTEAELEIDNDKLITKPNDCEFNHACAAEEELRSDIEKLKMIKGSLNFCPAKEETEKRKRIIKKIIKRKGAVGKLGECRNIGDAYFVFVCPPNCDILTINLVDIKPMAKAVNRNVVTV